jgi:hypothetical protein
VFAVTVYVAPVPETAVIAAPLRFEEVNEKLPTATFLTGSENVTVQERDAAFVGLDAAKTGAATVGAVVSTVQVYDAAELVFPADVAVTANVWEACDRPDRPADPVVTPLPFTLVQGFAAPSSVQANVTPVWASE